MAVALVKIALPWVDPSPSGPLSINTLHVDFGATPITAGTAEDVLDAVENLYSTGLAGLLPAPTLTGELLISVYDLDDPTPRVPVVEREASFTPALEMSLPAEVAMNVSFRAAYATGVSKRKFRGRIYLGPVAASALTLDPTGRYTEDIVDQVAGAFQTFAQAVADGGTLRWACGSEEFGFKDVSIVKVTNEPGTLRSRQGSASYATTVNL